VPHPDLPDDQLVAGVPDAFGRLWTPHRMAYIKGENKPSGPGEDEECPFDRAPKLTDEEGLSSPGVPWSTQCSTCTPTTPATC